MSLNRREFIKSSSAALIAAQAFAAESSRYRVGITSNTIGGWEGDPWVGFREAHEVGYRNVEAFVHSFKEYFDDKPAELQKRMDGLGLKFVTISNGGGIEMNFQDQSKHQKVWDDHMRLVRFIKKLGCTHLKINMGPRRPTGTTDEDLQHMAVALEELGRRSAGEGIRFAVHAHMWSQFENRHEIDFVMKNTDPKHVSFVLDTGHITLAGIDPVELARTLGHRIAEFHMKDTKPENRGGAKVRLARMDAMHDPPFFPLGNGGVDFPALKAHLDSIQWQGWLTVELDSSPFRPPKESARISKDYIEQTLGIPLEMT